MKVYIAEAGCYEERSVIGIYDSVERAIAANPGHYTRTLWQSGGTMRVTARWQSWANDKDWGSHIEITEHDLEDLGPLAKPDKVEVQEYRKADGGWDYRPITDDEANDIMSRFSA